MSEDRKKRTTVTMREQRELLYVMPFNAQHQGLREEQQDYFACSDLLDPEAVNRIGSAAVLADGMGGMENGRRASITAVNTFLNVYTALAGEREPLPEAMKQAALEANAAVSEVGGAGATLAAAVIKQNRLYWVSVGDSRIYILRRGLLRQLNAEHNYAAELQELVESGVISQTDAAVHPDREALTSYLGMGSLAQMDANDQEFPLFMGDLILLCSDGLYRTLSDREITAALQKSKEDPAQALVDAAMKKGKANQDNITVLILKII